LEISRGTVVGRTVLEGRTVHIADVQTDPEYTFLEAARVGGLHAMLGIPLLREGTPIGVIVLQRKSVQPFTDKQIELATTFADQAVIAIENVRLFDEVQARTRELSEALEQQTATSDVLRVISSSPGELEPVFRAMLENAARLCEASYGAMWLREGDAFRAAAFHGSLPFAYTQHKGWGSGTLYRAPPEAPLARVAETGKPLQIADLRDDQSYLSGKSPLTVASVDVAGVRTLVCVPMFKDDKVVGAIAIYRKEVRPFTDKQIALVTNFANQAVIAIENTRLLNELRESLQQQTATADVLKVISRSRFEVQPVFETVLENAVRLCEGERSFIFLFDGKVLRAAASYNTSPELRAHPRSFDS
jgi:GAF domain-containing protein